MSIHHETHKQVHFIMDVRTTLNELLALRLHQFEDEVRGIVEQAIKERGMERVLRDLEDTWRAMAFERDPQGGCSVLRVRFDNLKIKQSTAFRLLHSFDLWINLIKKFKLYNFTKRSLKLVKQKLTFYLVPFFRLQRS